MSDGSDLVAASRRVVYCRRLALFVLLIVIPCLLHEYNPTASPVYRATATLQLDVKPISEASIVSVEALDRKDLETAERLNTLAATMPNFALMRQLIREHRLVSVLHSTGEGVEGDRVDSLARELLPAVRVSVRKGTHLVDISVTHSNQKLAENLANWISVGVIQQEADRKFAGSRSAFDVLAKEAESLKAQLNQAETAVMDFRKRFNLALPMDEQEMALKGRLDELRRQSTDLSVTIDLLESDLEMVSQFDETASLDRLESVVSIYGSTEVSRIRELISKHRETLLLLEEGQEEWMAAHKRAADSLQEQYAREIRRAPAGLNRELERLRAKEQGLKRLIVKAEAEMLVLASQQVEYNILARDLAARALLYESVADRIREIDPAPGLADALLTVVQEARDARDVTREPSLRKLVLLVCLIGASGFFLIDAMRRLFR